MRYGSVCSGIEAATVAWHPLGWKAAFFSEIEAFPRAVLEHHYETPVHGDFTTIGENEYGAIDLLVGGTPCQSFSVAGLRKGLDDDRGNLALEFLRLADRKRPAWLVWENVPGVLSSSGGRDFGAFLGGLGELGYGWSYRVLDAQYFGVAQRRRRVFVVGYLGDWRPPAAVLFERHSLQGHPAPSREAGKGFAERVAPCLSESGGNARPGDNLQSTGYLHIMSSGQANAEIARELSPALNCNRDGAPIAFGGDIARTLSARYDSSPCSDRGMDVVAQCVEVLAIRGRGNGRNIETRQDGTANAILTPNGGRDGMGVGAIRNGMQVRRLTPVECERLQGFPDGYTAIPYRNKAEDSCPDGPRYKALGNSMAVPVMRWIGERINMVNQILQEGADVAH